jgi:hypothetical protein
VKASGARSTMCGEAPGGMIAAMLPQNPVSSSIDKAMKSSLSSIAGVIFLRAARGWPSGSAAHKGCRLMMKPSRPEG